jgi:hypothetical protein
MARIFNPYQQRGKQNFTGRILTKNKHNGLNLYVPQHL